MDPAKGEERSESGYDIIDNRPYLLGQVVAHLMKVLLELVVIFIPTHILDIVPSLAVGTPHCSLA